MKNAKAILNGNTGTMHLIGWITIIIMITSFFFVIQDRLSASQERVDTQIRYEIENHPRLERLEMNLKYHMNANGEEYID